jgi:serine/threonine protein kinase
MQLTELCHPRKGYESRVYLNDIDGRVYKFFPNDGQYSPELLLKYQQITNDAKQQFDNYPLELDSNDGTRYTCVMTINPIDEVKEENGNPYTVNEYIDGLTLEDYILNGTFSYENITAILRSLSLNINSSLDLPKGLMQVIHLHEANIKLILNPNGSIHQCIVTDLCVRVKYVGYTMM